MNIALPKIYPITDTRISNLSHAEQTRRLIKGGAKLIQLRDKHASSLDFYEDAKEAVKAARRTNTKIIINDRVDMALVLKASGVHLGQDDLPPKKVREILGDNAIIGFSTHNEKQAKASLKLPVNYIAVGPVFKTETKENTENVIGIEGLKRVREIIGNFPLVGIGGINLKNFQAVLDAGADTVALISEMLGNNSNDITKTMQRYILSTK